MWERRRGFRVCLWGSIRGGRGVGGRGETCGGGSRVKAEYDLLVLPGSTGSSSGLYLGVIRDVSGEEDDGPVGLGLAPRRYDERALDTVERDDGDGLGGGWLCEHDGMGVYRDVNLFTNWGRGRDGMEREEWFTKVVGETRAL